MGRLSFKQKSGRYKQNKDETDFFYFFYREKIVVHRIKLLCSSIYA